MKKKLAVLRVWFARVHLNNRYPYYKHQRRWYRPWPQTFVRYHRSCRLTNGHIVVGGISREKEFGGWRAWLDMGGLPSVYEGESLADAVLAVEVGCDLLERDADDGRPELQEILQRWRR